MSSISNGGGDLFIASGATAYYTTTWGDGGWQGNTLIECQPLNTGASLDTVLGNVHLNANGTYGFAFSVRDNGPNSTYFNVQVSSN